PARAPGEPGPSQVRQPKSSPPAGQFSSPRTQPLKPESCKSPPEQDLRADTMAVADSILPSQALTSRLLTADDVADILGADTDAGLDRYQTGVAASRPFRDP